MFVLKADSGEESEWTWETASSSDDEPPPLPPKNKSPPPPPKKRKSPSPPKLVSKIVLEARAIAQKYTRSNTAALCSVDDKPDKTKKSPATTHRTNRWLEAINADTKIKPQKANAERIPNFGKAVAMNRSLIGNKLQEEKKAVVDPPASRTSYSRPVSWAGNQYSDIKPPPSEKKASKVSS